MAPIQAFDDVAYHFVFKIKWRQKRNRWRVLQIYDMYSKNQINYFTFVLTILFSSKNSIIKKMFYYNTVFGNFLYSNVASSNCRRKKSNFANFFLCLITISPLRHWRCSEILAECKFCHSIIEESTFAFIKLLKNIRFINWYLVGRIVPLQII